MDNRTKRALVWIGGVSTVLLALTQLYDWITAPSSDLVAEVRYGELIYPPEIQEQFRLIHETLSGDRLNDLSRVLRFEFREDPARGTNYRELLEQVVHVLSSLKDVVPRSVTELRADGYWSVSIRNEGSGEAERVQLTLPRAYIASVTREGEEPRVTEVGERVKFDTLQPLETVEITAWTWSALGPFYEDDVRLTHAKGLGEVVIYGEAGPFGRWIERNGLFLLILALMLVPFVVLMWMTKDGITLIVKPAAQSSAHSEAGKDSDNPHPS